MSSIGDSFTCPFRLLVSRAAPVRAETVSPGAKCLFSGTNSTAIDELAKVTASKFRIGA